MLMRAGSVGVLMRAGCDDVLMRAGSVGVLLRAGCDDVFLSLQIGRIINRFSSDVVSFLIFLSMVTMVTIG